MQHSPHDELLYAAQELDHLANAFYITGNKDMQKKISFIARQIEEANKQILTDEAERTNKQLSIAEQSSRNVLNAVFAGIEMGKEK